MVRIFFLPKSSSSLYETRLDMRKSARKDAFPVLNQTNTVSDSRRIRPLPATDIFIGITDQPVVPRRRRL